PRPADVNTLSAAVGRDLEAAPPWAGLAPCTVVSQQDVVPERPGATATGATPPQVRRDAHREAPSQPPGSEPGRVRRYGLGSTGLTMGRRAPPRLPRMVRTASLV